MNERIKELAKDADIDWHRHWNDNESNRLQVFAELIVRECVLISRTSSDGFSAGKQMEEHFGVKS